MSTIQETFDKIVTHLIKQGTTSRNEEGECLYHDEETGRMCAIGCLFDNKYEVSCIENLTVDAEPVVGLLHLNGVLTEEPGMMYMLSVMQDIHDYKMESAFAGLRNGGTQEERRKVIYDVIAEQCSKGNLNCTLAPFDQLNLN